MAGLTVIANDWLADGFRLAGVDTRLGRPGPTLHAAVEAAMADDELGLLVVTEDLWLTLDERTRRRLEHLARPLVIAVPAGTVTEGTGRRELLAEMLERAIGYRLELGAIEP
jgi:vacuolar-type H+-ATPase subunit F/Vma7